MNWLYWGGPAKVAPDAGKLMPNMQKAANETGESFHVCTTFDGQMRIDPQEGFRVGPETFKLSDEEKGEIDDDLLAAMYNDGAPMTNDPPIRQFDQKPKPRFNWRGLGKAVIYTQLIAQAVGLFKLEGTLRLAWWIEDPWTARWTVFAFGIVLTLIFAPLNAWLSHRLQKEE